MLFFVINFSGPSLRREGRAEGRIRRNWGTRFQTKTKKWQHGKGNVTARVMPVPHTIHCTPAPPESVPWPTMFLVHGCPHTLSDHRTHPAALPVRAQPPHYWTVLLTPPSSPQYPACPSCYRRKRQPLTTICHSPPRISLPDEELSAVTPAITSQDFRRAYQDLYYVWSSWWWWWRVLLSHMLNLVNSWLGYMSSC